MPNLIKIFLIACLSFSLVAGCSLPKIDPFKPRKTKYADNWREVAYNSPYFSDGTPIQWNPEKRKKFEEILKERASCYWNNYSDIKFMPIVGEIFTRGDKLTADGQMTEEENAKLKEYLNSLPYETNQPHYHGTPLTPRDVELLQQDQAGTGMSGATAKCAGYQIVNDSYYSGIGYQWQMQRPDGTGYIYLRGDNTNAGMFVEAWN